MTRRVDPIEQAGADAQRAVPRNGVRWTLQCQCAKVTIVPSVAIRAPIRCLACGGVFVSVELAMAVATVRPPAWVPYGGWLAPLLPPAEAHALTSAARREERVPCPRCGGSIIDAITEDGTPDPVDADRVQRGGEAHLVLSMRTGKRPTVMAQPPALDRDDGLTWTRHRCP